MFSPAEYWYGSNLDTFWLFCPYAGDIFKRRELLEGLEPSTVIVGIDDELEMLPPLIMAAVHPFDFTIGPGMIWLCASMLDAVLATYLVEAMPHGNERPS